MNFFVYKEKVEVEKEKCADASKNFLKFALGALVVGATYFVASKSINLDVVEFGLGVCAGVAISKLGRVVYHAAKIAYNVHKDKQLDIYRKMMPNSSEVGSEYF